MLNKELCELFGIDKFQEWLTNEMEYYEDILNICKDTQKETSETCVNDFSKIISIKLNVLKDVQKRYSDYLQSNKETRRNPELSLDEIIYKEELKKEAKRRNLSLEDLLFEKAKEENISINNFLKLKEKFL